MSSIRCFGISLASSLSADTFGIGRDTRMAKQGANETAFRQGVGKCSTEFLTWVVTARPYWMSTVDLFQAIDELNARKGQ
jgi:hypothetical protein